MNVAPLMEHAQQGRPIKPLNVNIFETIGDIENYFRARNLIAGDMNATRITLLSNDYLNNQRTQELQCPFKLVAR